MVLENYQVRPNQLEKIGSTTDTEAEIIIRKTMELQDRLQQLSNGIVAIVDRVAGPQVMPDIGGPKLEKGTRGPGLFNRMHENLEASLESIGAIELMMESLNRYI